MGNFLIKPVLEEDFYFIYSSVVDSPISWGSLEELQKSDPVEFERDGEQRVERADKFGTSARFGKPLYMGVGNEWIVVREGWLQENRPKNAVWAEVPRKRMREFLALVGSDGYFVPMSGMRWFCADYTTDESDEEYYLEH